MTGWAPWCFSVFDLYGHMGLGVHALNPNISMQVLHIYTIPYTFPMVLTGRICSTIKGFLSLE